MSTIILALTLTAAASILPEADAVSAYRCGTPKATSARNVDAEAEFAAYDQRSVAIIAAALRNDQQRLSRLIAPDLRASIFYSDAGFSRGAGPQALVEFAKEVAPIRYEILREHGGPILPGDPCGRMESQITVKSDHGRAFVLRFRYRGGLLTELSAQFADLAAGKF